MAKRRRTKKASRQAAPITQPNDELEQQFADRRSRAAGAEMRQEQGLKRAAASIEHARAALDELGERIAAANDALVIRECELDLREAGQLSGKVTAPDVLAAAKALGKSGKL